MVGSGALSVRSRIMCAWVAGAWARTKSGSVLQLSEAKVPENLVDPRGNKELRWFQTRRPFEARENALRRLIHGVGPVGGVCW